MKKGVVVNGIQPGTPAATSDLRAGDVILKVDNVPVSLSRDVQREILGKKVGQSVTLELWRNGKVSSLTVKTGEQPDRMVRASNRPVPAEPPSRSPQPPSPPANFGLVVEDLPPASPVKGVQVTDIAPGSAADAAGLVRGDVITEVAGKPVKGTGEFDAAIAGADLSRGVMLLVDRAGSEPSPSSSLKRTRPKRELAVLGLLAAEHHGRIELLSPRGFAEGTSPPGNAFVESLRRRWSRRCRADHEMVRASLRLSQCIFRKFLLGKPRKICIERRDSIGSSHAASHLPNRPQPTALDRQLAQDEVRD